MECLIRKDNQNIARPYQVGVVVKLFQPGHLGLVAELVVAWISSRPYPHVGKDYAFVESPCQTNAYIRMHRAPCTVHLVSWLDYKSICDSIQRVLVIHLLNLHRWQANTVVVLITSASYHRHSQMC